MSVTDPIADMFTCIRNANIKYFEKIDIPASNLKESILEILKKEGFIKNFKKIENDNQGLLRVFLKYGPNKEKIINGLKRVSTPGLRIYKGLKDIPKVRSGLGIAIISTPKGLITDRDARYKKVGGEIIGYIW
jgi:small subunit ribosomal protein S8